jgi:hypothetical protein
MYVPHEQITLRQKGLSEKNLNLLLSRCTMLSSLTLVGVTDLCSLFSMVAEKGCRLQHLTIHGPFNHPEHLTQQQVVSIFNYFDNVKGLSH